MRIVSLLPSATEIICYLGLEPYLVGISHSCDYPPSIKQLPRVTTTLVPKTITSLAIDDIVHTTVSAKQSLYQLDIAALTALKPDVIVTQSLCTVCAVTEAELAAALSELAYRPQIINLQPVCLQDVFDTLLLIGEATNFKQQAQQAVEKLTQRLDTVLDNTQTITAKPNVAFLEWLDPLFNTGHWTPELIDYAGGNSVLNNPGKPATKITVDELIKADADVLLIACCGFDIDRTLVDLERIQSTAAWQQLKAVKQASVYVVSGNDYFSRPGPRLIDSLEIIAHCLHPTTFAKPEHLPAAQNYRCH